MHEASHRFAPSAKLNFEEAAKAKALLALGVPKTEVGRLFGLSLTAIQAISDGRSYRGVPAATVTFSIN